MQLKRLLVFLLAPLLLAAQGTEETTQRLAIWRDLKHYKRLSIGGVEMRMDAVPWYRTFNPPPWTLTVKFSEHIGKEYPNGFVWAPGCQISTPDQYGVEFIEQATLEGFTVRVPGNIQAFAWACQGISKRTKDETEKLERFGHSAFTTLPTKKVGQ